MNLDAVVNTSIKARALRQSMVELLSSHHLVFGELEILHMLKNKKSLQPTEIAERLHQERATVSRVIKQLFHKNLITYTNDLEDRRRVYVKITRKGSQVINSVLNAD